MVKCHTSCRKYYRFSALQEGQLNKPLRPVKGSSLSLDCVIGHYLHGEIILFIYLEYACLTDPQILCGYLKEVMHDHFIILITVQILKDPG